MCCETCRAEGLAEQELDAKAHQVFDNLMSPFCPGKTLNDCPSSEAAKLKSDLKEKLRSGVQPQAVIDEMVQQYGEELLAAPTNEGFGKFAWLVPIIFPVLGAIGLLLWLNKKRRGEKS